MPTLLMFAAIRDAAGCARTDVDGSSVGEVLRVASERFGDRFERVLSCCSVLVGDVVVSDAWNTPVGARDEIALLPPVSGGAPMIDVGDKDETARSAEAVCALVFADARARDVVLGGTGRKGDAVGPAVTAGMLAAKRVPELLPHCHPVRLTSVDVVVKPSGAEAIEVRTTVRGIDRTGFEMEALTACSVAALTLYDIGKAEDPRMRIEGLRVVAKSGGRSGSVTFE